MPFDPYDLPDDPVVAIDIGLDSTGRETATVDGRPVESDAGESARAAAVRTVAELVDRLPGVGAGGRPRAGVRARINGPGFRDYDVAVDREGRLYVPIGPPPEPATPAVPRPLEGRPSALGSAASAAVPTRTEPARGGSGGSGGWSPTFLDDRPGSPPAGVLGGERRPDAAPVARPGAATAAATGLAALGRAPGSGQGVPTEHRPSGEHRPSEHRPSGEHHPSAEHHPDAEHTVRVSPVIPADRLAGLVRAARDQRAASRSAPGALATDDAGEADAREAGPDDPGTTGLGRTGTGRRRVRPAVVAVVVAAAIVVAALAIIARTILHPRDTRPSEASAAASGGRFPGTVAPGWSADPRWVSTAVEAGGGRVLAFGDAVAYVTAQHRLVAVDATSGVTRWQVPLPAGTLRDGLAHTTIDGRAVVAAHIDDTLAWWAAADGQGAGSVALPEGARTTFLGAAPLVGVDDRTVAVVRGNALRRLALPAGAYALAASERGQVTAASGRGWWHLRPGVAAGAPRAWEVAAPDDEAPRAAPVVVGYLGDSILTLYPADRTGRRHVVANTDAAQVRVSFRGPMTPPAGTTVTAGVPWWPAPSGTWGVLGRTLVDLDRGEVSDLGDWTTTWITADRAYGTIDGRPVQVGPEVPRADVGAEITIPEVVTPAGAVLRARAGDGERLYLLPPS